MSLGKRLAGRQLYVKAEVRATFDADDSDVMDFAHIIGRERRTGYPFAQLGSFPRFNVNRHVAASNPLVQRRFHAVGQFVPLLDRRVGRNFEHPVNEGRAAGLTDSQAANLDRRFYALDRLLRDFDEAHRRLIHQRTDVAADQRGSGADDQHGDDQRGDRIGVGNPGADHYQADQDCQCAREVGSKMERVCSQCGT